jgi:hypothetical protein
MTARMVRCTEAGQKDKRKMMTRRKGSWWSVTGEALYGIGYYRIEVILGSEQKEW